LRNLSILAIFLISCFVGGGCGNPTSNEVSREVEKTKIDYSNPEICESCSTLSNPEIGIELIYADSNKILEYGQTVTVKWKVDPEIVPAVVLQVSHDRLSGFKNIMQYSISTTENNNSRVNNIKCMDTLWTIGSEWDNFTYNSSPVYIRVAKYNDEEFYQSVSDVITVNQN
jgi:hypothetical protein